MKTKNAKIIVSIISIVIICVVCLGIFISNKNSIIGEWKISSFVFDDKTLPFDEYGKYYGEDNEKAYSYVSITFKKNNLAVITTPAYEKKDSKHVECSYSIYNKIITLSNEDENIEIFKITGSTLQTLDSDFLKAGYIFKKQ